MKKLFAIMMVLMMLFSICAPVYAAELIPMQSNTESTETPEEPVVPEEEIIPQDETTPEEETETPEEPTEKPALPVAIVTEAPEYENVDLPWGKYGAWSPTEGLDSHLKAAYIFTCQDTGDAAKLSPYANWYCDFYVKLDQDLGENEIFLGGNYGSFGWVGFHNGELTLAANTEIPLLGSVTTNPWSYADVASFVGTFICGVGNVNNSLSGATFTVMLRLTNPEDTSEYYNVSTIEYEFDCAVKNTTTGKGYHSLKDAVADANDGETITLMDDAALTETLHVTKSITIDGNGKKITNNGATNTALMLGDTLWGAAEAKTCSITLQNAVFDGWTTEHVVRMQGVTANISGCTFQNCKQPASGVHGLVSTSATSNVTVQNCTFDQNECTKAIHFDDNAAENTLAVTNNTFTQNKVSGSSLVFFGDNGSYSATGNRFEGNTVAPAASNAGIIYGADVTVTGNTFKNNSVTGTGARTGIIVADSGTANQNVFSGNTLAENTTVEPSYVATVVQKGGAETSMDLNANYWGDGAAAVEGEDYVIAKDGGAVTAKTYYTDEALSDLVDPDAPKPPVVEPEPEDPPYYPPVWEDPEPEEPEVEPAPETPVTPAPETPVAPPAEEKVTVAVSGNENTVEVEAAVSGTTATIEKMEAEHLDEIIGEHVETGTVTIDFSEVTASAEEGAENAHIDTVEIPAEVVKQIAEAVSDPSNDAESLEIVLNEGMSIEFNAEALANKVSQVEGADITISIKPAAEKEEGLSAAQQDTVGDRVAYDINVTSAGEHISDMGGKIVIHAPYELKADEVAEGIVVYYVDDNGNREKCVTSYDSVKKRVNWETNHLSVYMIGYEAPASAGDKVPAGDAPVVNEPAADNAEGGNSALWIAIGAAAAAAVAGVAIVGKKRKA